MSSSGLSCCSCCSREKRITSQIRLGAVGVKVRVGRLHGVQIGGRLLHEGLTVQPLQTVSFCHGVC